MHHALCASEQPPASARGQHEIENRDPTTHLSPSSHTFYNYRTYTLHWALDLVYCFINYVFCERGVYNCGRVHTPTIRNIEATVQQHNIGLIRLNLFIVLQGNGARCVGGGRRLFFTDLNSLINILNIIQHVNYRLTEWHRAMCTQIKSFRIEDSTPGGTSRRCLHPCTTVI